MKKNLFKLSFTFVFFGVLFFASQVKADNASPTPDTVMITIRDGSINAFSGTVTLPDVSSPDVPITAKDLTAADLSTTTLVSARSVLAILKNLEASTTSFKITDLQYYNSLSSFIINCIAIPASSASPECYNWTYAVNGSYPFVGVNQTVLQNGDVVYLFFGPPRQATVSTATPTEGVSFTAKTEHYDLASGRYLPSPGLTLGVGTPNPDFSFTEIATSTADINGEATFMLTATGTYAIGIKEDYYYPTVSITVMPAPVLAPVSEQAGGAVILPTSSGGGGGGAPAVQSLKVDLAKATEYLNSQQTADGSFGSALITDWAAVALASVNPNGPAAQKLKNYLLADPNPSAGLNAISDYARRAMALLSLGLSPYDATKTDYVKAITDTYDGRQFGDASLYNDDIFALLVLSKSGYGAADEMIAGDANFILSKQLSDGSWGGVDLTAAAVQAFKPLSSISGVSDALSKARSYLVSAQRADGGFGNAFATPWAMQAIAALGEKPADWKINNLDPENSLAAGQAADGGLEKDNPSEANRIWATIYALPAVQAKPWFELMSSVSKKIISPDEPSGNLSAENSLASSTLDSLLTATSTVDSLNQATTTEISKLEIEKDVASSTVKSIAPKVLGEKITASSSASMADKISAKSKISKVVKKIIAKPAEVKPLPLKPQVPVTFPVENSNQANPSAENKFTAAVRAVFSGLASILKTLADLL